MFERIIRLEICKSLPGKELSIPAVQLTERVYRMNSTVCIPRTKAVPAGVRGSDPHLE